MDDEDIQDQLSTIETLLEQALLRLDAIEARLPEPPRRPTGIQLPPPGSILKVRR